MRVVFPNYSKRRRIETEKAAKLSPLASKSITLDDHKIPVPFICTYYTTVNRYVLKLNSLMNGALIFTVNIFFFNMVCLCIESKMVVTRTIICSALQLILCDHDQNGQFLETRESGCGKTCELSSHVPSNRQSNITGRLSDQGTFLGWINSYWSKGCIKTSWAWVTNGEMVTHNRHITRSDIWITNSISTILLL